MLFEELGSCLLVSVLRWVQIPDFLFIHFVSSEPFAIGQDMQHVIIRLNCVESVGIFYFRYIIYILFANKGLNCCVMFVSLLSYELLNLFRVILCTEVYLFTRPCHESWCGLTVSLDTSTGQRGDGHFVPRCVFLSGWRVLGDLLRMETNPVTNFDWLLRYGVKGVAYLQDRNGQVLYLPTPSPPQWVSGTLTRTDDALTVDCALGSHRYCLLEHITVWQR